MFNPKYLLYFAAACLLFIGGALTDQLLRPARVIESKTHHESTIKLQTIEQKLDMSEVRKLIQEEMARVRKDIAKNTTKITKPDGTVIETTSETDKSVIETASKTTDEKATKLAADSKVKLLDETLKVDTQFKSVERGSGPTWAAGIFAGWQTIGAAPSFNLTPNYDRLVLGLTVERRILGPIWLGGFGTTSGLFGLDLKLVH